MLTIKRLEDILAVARSKGAPDDMEVRFCANASGVAANAIVEVNAAANFRAGYYLQNPLSEVVLEAPGLVLNQES
jgi:hypothetical protein